MSELGEKHKQHIVVENLDATTGENAPKQSELGFRSHGLVIHDHQGNVVFKQADHGVNEAEVEAFVTTYLKKS